MNTEVIASGDIAPHSHAATHPGLVDGPVYVDYNATTPVDPRVTEAAMPYWTVWFGNPSSGHLYGDEPRRALGAARSRVASLIGASCPEEIVFTASGSEANLLALRGAVLAAGTPETHLIVSAIEHPAVAETARALHRWHGTRVTVLPVDHDGLVDPAALDSALTAVPTATAVVSVMAANNETGVVQPINQLAEVAHARGALVHCDAAQVCGKVPVDVNELGVDLLTVVGHKMYAPRGAAALYARSGVALEPIVYGGGQERGLRSGTENVALAVALGTAADLAAGDLAAGFAQRIATLRDDLHRRLAAALPGRVWLNGPASSELRLPNTLNISIEGVAGHRVVEAASMVAVSTGSACHSGVRSPSPVLMAMGLPEDRALGAVRLSLGRWSGQRDIDTVVQALVEAVHAVGDDTGQ
jgi:cysteine desulfurase